MSTNKPTIKELNQSLQDLVKWQQFALYLPGVDQTIISIIEKDKRDDLVEQKRILYDKWLQVYPNASWDNVTEALEVIGENTIAKQLREKYPSSLSNQVKKIPDQNDCHTQAVSPSCGQQLPLVESLVQPDEVTVPEDIVKELDELQYSFVDLTQDVKSNVQQKLDDGTTDISAIVFRVQEARAYSIPSLKSVTTAGELFEAIRPHYSFLNCYLIVNIALFLSGVISNKATEYKEKIVKFMKTTKIRVLQNTLKRYSMTFRYSSDAAMVELVVENGWDKQNLWLVRTLVETLFPVKHPDELLWYDIVPGSVVMTFITFEHMTSSLIESSGKKAELLQLIGVISLRVGGRLVWERKDAKSEVSFSFDACLIQATRVNNVEAVRFLLQHASVNINAKNTSSLRVKDETSLISRSMVESASILASCFTRFTILLKDIEYYLFQNSNTSQTSSIADIPHHLQGNFLNGSVLAGQSHLLPQPLSETVKQYMAMLKVLKRKSLVVHLCNPLRKYIPTPIPDSTEVIITLHSVWRACSIWYVEQLGQLIFTPTLFHKFQWFRVYTSEDSLRLVLLMPNKELVECSVNEILAKNESLMPLLGVTSIQFNNDTTMTISNHYSTNYDDFTFMKAIERSKELRNDEIVDLLLQINQSPVDFFRLKGPDNNMNFCILPAPDSTPLMIACCNDNSLLVRLLLDYNADPNIQSRNGCTALMYSTGNIKIFQMLLDYGADINVRTSFNETVAYFACWAGNVRVIEMLAKSNHDLLFVVADNRYSPLAMASYCGHGEIVRRLLQTKVNPNFPGSGGLIALQLASRHGCIEIVEKLLQAKADPNILDHEECTALHFASDNDHIEIVRRLIQANADLNIQNRNGETALTLASRCGHTETVGTLLQAKANPNIQIHKGWTALQLAAIEGHTETVGKLLKAKADPNIQDNEGWTALQSASYYGHTKIVVKLLQANANPYLEDHDGLTALDVAISKGHSEVIEELCNNNNI